MAEAEVVERVVRTGLDDRRVARLFCHFPA